MKNYNNCPICDNTNFSKSLNCKDYTVSHKVFSIVNCKNCGFRFTNPIPKEENIGEFYKSDDYISHSNTKKGIVNKMYQTVRNLTLVRKVNLLKKESSGKKLLDIGCGTGEFLNKCQKENYDCIGIEPSEEAKDYAEKNYGLKVKSESYIANINNNSIDIITMWHVLEHVYHLNERINEIDRILKKDGVLIVAVPNYTSYDAQYYKKHWAAYDLPRHLYHFSPKDIKKLFQKHGFKLTQTLPMKYDSYYVSMLSEKYKTNNSNLLKAFYRGFISNVKARRSSEHKYSSQIYILRKTEN